MVYDEMIIGTLITSLLNYVGGWFTRRQELSMEKWKTKIEIERHKQALAVDKERNNHEWEMANLTDKDKMLRWVSFILFSSPFIIALIAPEHVALYFEKSIHSIPIWWQKTYMAMMGGIWGIASLKNTLPTVIDSFRNPRKTKVKKDG
ncbi:hypothetical protein N9937_01810 [bacterium]|nr:hypothetical protein [bacterium]